MKVQSSWITLVALFLLILVPNNILLDDAPVAKPQIVLTLNVAEKH